MSQDFNVLVGVSEFFSKLFAGKIRKAFLSIQDKLIDNY